MNNAQKVTLILLAAKTIFDVKLAGKDITTFALRTNMGKFPGRTFVDGKVKGFDFQVKDDKGIIALRIIEQNPDKEDGFGNLKQNAVLARAGHKIAWVIRTDSNKFLGKVQDGKWVKNTPRATTMITNSIDGAGTAENVTAQDQYDSDYDHYDQDWQRALPDIDPSEVAVYVAGV